MLPWRRTIPRCGISNSVNTLDLERIMPYYKKYIRYNSSEEIKYNLEVIGEGKEHIACGSSSFMRYAKKYDYTCTQA